MKLTGTILGYAYESHTNKDNETKKSTRLFLETGIDKLRGKKVDTIVAFTNKAEDFLAKLDEVGINKNVNVWVTPFKGNLVYDDDIVVNK